MGTHVDGEDPIVTSLPASRLAEDETLREQPQQDTLREKHQHLPFDWEDTPSQVEVQA